MSTQRETHPEGTVTVLSTDLVGSTLLNQRLGDQAATTLERALAALAQEQIEKHRGVLIKDTGDGLMVAFQSARRAVVCAQEIQRAVERRNRGAPEQAVQLRVGLHTGEVARLENLGADAERPLPGKRPFQGRPHGRRHADEHAAGDVAGIALHGLGEVPEHIERAKVR